MGRLVARLIVNAAALFAAIRFVPGVTLTGVAPGAIPGPRTILNLLIVALILGLVNGIVRPIFKFLTCAINFFTLGLFVFVINALMLLLTAAIAARFELGFIVDGFVPALLGSIVISIVNVVLSIFIRDRDD